MDEPAPGADPGQPTPGPGQLRVLLDHLGLPSVDDEEAALVLDLARAVAHGWERRFAPLAAYALGLADRGGDREDRLLRLRALIEVVTDDGDPAVRGG